MRMLKLKTLYFVAVLVTLAFVATAYAALPPGAYERLKAKAPEKLKIKILEVERKEQDPKYPKLPRLIVTFRAEVLEAERSETALRPGEKIIIHSYHWTGDYQGPKNPPLLPKGWIGIAYLKLEGRAEVSLKSYSLAAFGASFEKSQ